MRPEWSPDHLPAKSSAGFEPATLALGGPTCSAFEDGVAPAGVEPAQQPYESRRRAFTERGCRPGIRTPTERVLSALPLPVGLVDLDEVRPVGVEPTRPLGHRLLKAARLPFHHGRKSGAARNRTRRGEVWNLAGGHRHCPEGCRTGLEPASTRITTWSLGHFGFRHKPLSGIEPPRPTFAESAPHPAAEACTASGSYGTRTRDLHRDRVTSTPSALTIRSTPSRNRTRDTRSRNPVLCPLSY
jgi:hypothetical protein